MSTVVPRAPRRADRREHALAHLPERRLLHGVVGEARGLEQQPQAAARLRAPRARARAGRASSRPWNSTSRPAAPAGSVRERGGHAGLRLAPSAGRRGPSPRAPRRRRRAAARSPRRRAWMSGKRSSPVYFDRQVGHRVEDRARDEGERALGADRAGGGGSRPGARSRRSALSEYPVVFFIRYLGRMRAASAALPSTLAPQGEESRRAGAGSGRRQCRRRRPASAVSMTMPEGSTNDERLERVVGVLRDAAAHAARVVRQDAAHHAGLRWTPGRARAWRPSGASRALTAAPITPGCTRTRRPSSSTSTCRQCRATVHEQAVVTAWPDRLVPAARKVSGTWCCAGDVEERR